MSQNNHHNGLSGANVQKADLERWHRAQPTLTLKAVRRRCMRMSVHSQVLPHLKRSPFPPSVHLGLKMSVVAEKVFFGAESISGIGGCVYVRHHFKDALLTARRLHRCI